MDPRNCGYCKNCGAGNYDACTGFQPSASAEPVADPMDWPLPCDVTVGHGTMRKGVKLSTLVLRMKTLYEMATGQNADEVASRTPEQRRALFEGSPLGKLTAAREQEADATGEEPVAWRWEHYAPSNVRLNEGLSFHKVEPTGHAFPLDENGDVWAETRVTPLYATPTTSTTGKVDASRVRALSEYEIDKWWASENGLEDHDMCKLKDFREVVRAVEKKLGIGTPKSAGEGA